MPSLGNILFYVQVICIVVAALLVARMMVTFHKVRPISKRSCVIGMIFPLLILLVYSVLFGIGTVPRFGLFFLVAIGFALGFWRGKTTRLWIEENVPRAQHSMWFLAVWGITFVLMQILVTVGRETSIQLGAAALFISTALALGSQGNLLVRLRKLIAEHRWTPAPAVTKHFCTSCGTELVPGDRFCRGCRAAL